MSQKLRILHLEDQDEDVDLVRHALASAGWDCSVLQARNSAEFLAALHRAEVDVILSDSGIPGFDGVSALRLARQQNRKIPFIFVSGGQRAEQFEWFKAPELATYARKSHLDELAPMIEHALRYPGQVHPSGINRELEGLKTLLQVVHELILARDLESVGRIVLRAARKLLSADGASFVLREGEECVHTAEDTLAPLWNGSRFPMGASIAGWTILHQKEAIIQDIYADPRIPTEIYRSTFVRSLMTVPIGTQTPVGAIVVYWAEQRRASFEDASLLHSLAESTSVAMENARLSTDLSLRLTHARQEITSAQEGLQSFSDSLSNDLASQLGTIASSGQSMLAGHGETLGEEGRRHLYRMVDAARQMDDLLASLQGLIKIEAHPVRRRSVDLAEIGRHVAAEIAARHPDREVEFDFADTLPADADPDLIEIALRHLLSNAWKYTGVSAIPKIQLGEKLSLAGERLFYVSDNGTGFDPEYSAHLFGVFQRIRSKGTGGNGTGLATTRRIIRKHGGRIWAEAARNRGATFYFTLG